MKYALLPFFVLAAAALLLFSKIRLESVEPPARIIPDMTLPSTSAPQAPPPGIVPHSSSPALKQTETDAPTLFAQRCAACHGANGNGQSYVAAQQGMPEVNDLTTGTVTPEELYRTLTEGRGAMPAHGERLSEQARRELIQYIQTTLHQP